MADFNNVSVSGRLGSDPETRFFDSGSCVTRFSLAVTEYIKGEQRTQWIRVEAWGKTAEIIANNVTKGDRVGLVGSLKTEQWESNGQKNSRTVVLAQQVILMGGGSRKVDEVSGDVEPVAATPTSTPSPAAALADCPF